MRSLALRRASGPIINIVSCSICCDLCCEMHRLVAPMIIRTTRAKFLPKLKGNKIMARMIPFWIDKEYRPSNGFWVSSFAWIMPYLPTHGDVFNQWNFTFTIFMHLYSIFFFNVLNQANVAYNHQIKDLPNLQIRFSKRIFHRRTS